MSVLGTIVSDLKKAGEDVKAFLAKAAADAPKVVADVAADESKIGPVLEAFLPGSANAIALADAVLNKVAQAVEDAGTAAAQNGLNVNFDKSLVATIQAVISDAKAAFKVK